MTCDKGTCCKWTYIILSLFVFMLGFLALAPMYVNSPQGVCSFNLPDNTDPFCSCHKWMTKSAGHLAEDMCSMDDNADGCEQQMCMYDQPCCEKKGFTYHVGGHEDTGYNNGAQSLLNIHGYGIGTIGCTKPINDEDATNTWNAACALAGPDKIALKANQYSAAWFEMWMGATGVCHYRLTSEEDGCDWDAGADTCECTFRKDTTYSSDKDCVLADCQTYDYECSCNDTICMASGMVGGEDFTDCNDCDYTSVENKLVCRLNSKDCKDEDRQELSTEVAAGCDADGDEFWCEPATESCKDRTRVYQGFFNAFVLFILGEVVLGLAMVLSILSICTSKISCLKGCFTKFARFIICLLFLGGSTFASASFALFDLMGVQGWSNLVNPDDGTFMGPPLCSGQPGVLFENTSLTGITASNYSCWRRTPTFYLYIVLVVSCSWLAFIAAFSTICCCNPEKAEEERANEAP